MELEEEGILWFPKCRKVPHRTSLRKVNCIPVLLLVVLSLLAGCDGSSLPEDYLPQIQMLEIISSPLNRSSAVNLLKERNSDVIIGEDTSPTSRILMKCNATYPVQWVYLGDGNPEFTTFTNVKWNDDPDVPMSFEAEASLGLLGFQGVLREEDTGNYTCRSIQDPLIHSFYFVYVPGDNLFASPNGTNITYTGQDMFLRIPCGVSHPKASVTLCKKDKNGELKCPVSGASGFNTKGGFLVNLKKQRNPSGTYVCTGNYKRTIRVVEHNVMKEGEKPKPVSPVEAPPTYIPKPGKNLCDPSPCGKQAECSVVDGRAVCYCFRGLNGDPYDECAPGKCRSSKDCPRGKFCRQGQCTSDPCNPSPCGKGGECTLYRGQSKCSCERGYTGLPPNCVKSCANHFECGEDEACIKSICQSPCPGPCGQNAECRALTNGSQRTAQCSCPAGFLGDPLKNCYKFNSTTPGPWNNCPPGYVGQPPTCKRKECNSDLDCPYGRKCKDLVCEKGFDPECSGKCGMNAICSISPTSKDPICSCPSGTTGNPMIQCSGTPDSPPSTPNHNQWGDPCFPNPCQGPAECHVIQGSRACLCPAGWTGDPSNCIRLPTNFPTSAFPSYPSSNFPTSNDLPSSSFPTSSIPHSSYPSSSFPTSNVPTSHFPSSNYPTSNGPPSTYPTLNVPSSKYPSTNYPTSNFPASHFPPVSSTRDSEVMCRFDMECRQGDTCLQGRCQDPCNGLCGFNAICDPGIGPGSYPRKYRSISISQNGKLLRSQPQQPESRCSCPQGHEGNPYVSCIPIRTRPPPPPTQPLPSMGTSADPICFPSPCGRHAECSIVNNAPLCECNPGFEGNPYEECRYNMGSPPSNSFGSTSPTRPTSVRTTGFPSSELDYQGRSWGHYGGGVISRDPPPPMSDGDVPPRPRPPYPTSHYGGSGYQGGNTGVIGHPPPYLPDPTTLQVGDTPTPKTLGRPMSPLDTPAPFSPYVPPNAPPHPPDDLRDECSFRNPYADYDMESCGVGRRCERDHRGVKRCNCISPFDCLGPTSTYLGGKCQTSRDCLLSNHICINETCKDPCSPAHSPCADVMNSECRVIEGNVLCTCARGFVGSPANGLDCRPKRNNKAYPILKPSSVAILNDQNKRKFILIHGLFRNDSSTNLNNLNLTDSNNNYNASVISASFDDDDDDNGDGVADSYESEEEPYDLTISSGSGDSEDNDNEGKGYQRRHNEEKQMGSKRIGKSILLGQCGFGSGRYCDEKSQCKVIDGRPLCVCKAGYKGEYPYCKPECEKHEDCPETMACQYHQCMDPCMEESQHCASNAFCSVTNHTASCKCGDGFVGIPWIQCNKIEEAVPKDGCMGFNCRKRSATVR